MLVPLDRDRLASLDALRASEWRGPLTTPEFLDRNERLRVHRYGSRIESWGWSPDGGRTLIASCDLLPIALGAAAGGAESAWLLASVVTLPAERGKGHASRMLEALLERRGDKPWLLFSDIGPEFYARWGFRALPQVSHTVAAGDGEVDLAAASAAFVAETIASRRKGGRHYTPEEIDWIAERYRAFAEFRDLIDVPVVLDVGEAGSPVFVAVDAVRDALALLWREPGDEKALRRAQDAAGALGLASVTYWEPAEATAEGTKPEWPMVRDEKGALAPVADVQLIDWW
jgi:GNAT superfamily N-acetyltransferase